MNNSQIEQSIGYRFSDEGKRKIARELRGFGDERLIALLVGFNTIYLFCRFQDTVSILGLLKIGLIFSLATVPFSLGKLQRARCPQMYVMIAFMLYGAAWVPLARNNRWALSGVQGLTQEFLTYLLPIIIFMQFAGRLRSLSLCLYFICIYLGTYAVLNNGFGPGGFIGDENDLCAVLDMMIAFPLILFSSTKSRSGKCLAALAIVCGLAGIVASNSRGGFLGLVAVLGYIFYQSKRKMIAIVFGVLLVGVAIPFVPSEYWYEMYTIKNTNEGTAKGRKELWSIGINIWLHPPHILTGTGMKNSPFRMKDFEPRENHLPGAKSLGGRSIHNSYIQLLADLGLVGMGLFIYFVTACFRGNRKWEKILAAKIKVLRGMKRSKSYLSERGFISFMERELLFSMNLLRATSVAWMGILVAITFIDTVYYATHWALGSICAAAQFSAYRASKALDTLGHHTISANTSSSDSGQSA